MLRGIASFVFCGTTLVAGVDSESQRRIPRAAPVDLKGKTFDFTAFRQLPVAVLVFVRCDCPISNRYAPELKRLHGQFMGRGVEYRLVYTDKEETADSIRRHLDDYDLSLTALRDPGHVLVESTGVSVTPEVAVFAAGQLVYRGRIDDRYSSPGKMRSAPTTRDLEAAILAVLDGRPVRLQRTQAFGCAIPSSP